MKMKTSGQIYRIIKEIDEDTVIRRLNMRQYVQKNNLKYIITQKKWLIDFDDFINSLNPTQIQEPQKFPRMRSKKTAMEEWNKTHRKKIKHHIVDKICSSGRIFVYHNGRYNVINYDQLEEELIRILKEKGEY